MRQAIQVLKQLVDEGVLLGYALGGGMAATFYIEPVLTYDLDIFVLLPRSPGLLVSLSPVYERLAELGIQPDREHVVVGSLPLQLIPAYNPLVEEAVRGAVVLPFADTSIQVVSPEYLVAIMLQTGRPKDLARITLFEEEAAIDQDRLEALLKSHGLEDKWRKISEKGDA